MFNITPDETFKIPRAAVDTGALQRCSDEARLVYIVIAAAIPPNAIFAERYPEELAGETDLAEARIDAALAELKRRHLIVIEHTIIDSDEEGRPIDGPMKIMLVTKAEDIDRIRYDPWQLIKGDAGTEARVAGLIGEYMAEGDSRETAEAKAAEKVAAEVEGWHDYWTGASTVPPAQ